MLCDKCSSNNATTHVKKIINGNVAEYTLCDRCAAEEGIGRIYGSSVSQMLKAVFGDASTLMPERNVKHCPACGTAFAEIVENGKVGCAECYQTFYNDLYPYLRRLHGTVKHAGKIPNSAPLAIIPTEETVDSLRLEMNRLVGEERFEEAAVVRDKIKSLMGNKT